ncbi:MAG: 3'-5' exonuclease domain-containing protein 2 [Verrucomicrobia bacterium]|nr:3'-5' exonuclease domain-containing protein 2 [Verrucomicrobiota bacterium]
MQYAISKQEINQKPLMEFQGDVRLIREPGEVSGALAEIAEAMATEPILGFDTETRPAFRKGEAYLPSLLQLAVADRAWLFQLKRLGDLGDLFAVLADPAVTKAGVAVSRDVDELRELCVFKPAGFADVGHMAEQRGFRNTGLRPLTALLLDHRISKGAQVSNWAAEQLTDKQIVYAATDAWISRKLYLAVKDLPLRNPDETESRHG